MTTNTITLNTVTAADTLAVQPVATTAQDRLSGAMELLAQAIAGNLLSDTNALAACTEFAQEILESVGVDITKKRVVFNHNEKFTSFSKGEIDILNNYGIRATNVPKKSLSLLVVTHKKEISSSDGQEYILWQAWDLEEGKAVKIAKPKAEKKPDGLDMRTIAARWREHENLTKDQTAVLMRALGLIK